MKNKICLLLLAVPASLVSFSQIKVPQKVKDAFAAKFPNATHVNWGKENAKEFEAEFTQNSVQISANFAMDGSWVETETVVNANTLPPAIPAAIRSKYPNATVSRWEKVEKPGSTYYETVVKVNNKKKEVEVSPEGKIL